MQLQPITLDAAVTYVAAATVLVLLCLYIVVYLGRFESGRALMWPLLAAGLWGVTFVFYRLTPDLRLRDIWFWVSMIGPAVVAQATYAMAHFFRTRGAPLPRHMRVALTGSALGSMAAVLTNPWHELLWTTADWQPLFWGLMAVIWGWIFAAMLACGRVLVLEHDRLRRLQALLLITGMALPFLANALDLAGLKNSLTTPPVPLAVTALLYVAGIRYADLFDFVPASVEQLMGRLGAGFLALDSQGRIRQCNDAATALLAGRPDDSWVKGRRFEQFLPQAAALDLAAPFTCEVTLGERVVRVTGNPTGNQLVSGTVVLMEDITEYKRMVSELERQTETMRSLHAITAELAGARDMAESVPKVVALATRSLEADAISWRLCYPESRLIRPWLDPTADWKPLPDMPRLWEDLQRQGWVVDEVHGPTALLLGEPATPVTYPAGRLLLEVQWPGQEYGYLVEVLSRHRRYNRADADMLRSVCAEVVATKQRLRMYEQTRQMAERDFLTKLYNHRYMQGLLEQLLRPGQGVPQPLTLALIDIDSFKAFNDTYGHSFGDRVIQFVADMIERGLPEGAVSARYGGDEFVIVFPGSSEQVAEETCRRLVEAVAQGRLRAADGAPVPVKISVGLARFPWDALDARALIECADQAMYRAKARGGQGYLWTEAG